MISLHDEKISFSTDLGDLSLCALSKRPPHREAFLNSVFYSEGLDFIVGRCWSAVSIRMYGRNCGSHCCDVVLFGD